MSIVVFWLQDGAKHLTFKDLELVEALAFCQRQRNEPGVSHVSLSSENPDSVGKPGVDSVQDGLLPNGEGYGWKKRRV